MVQRCLWYILEQGGFVVNNVSRLTGSYEVDFHPQENRLVPQEEIDDILKRYRTLDGRLQIVRESNDFWKRMREELNG